MIRCALGLFVLSFSLLSTGCISVRVKGDFDGVHKRATGFINKSMVVDGEERKYAVYVPRYYDSDRKWPLIVFLHGAGERGDDGLKQTEVGIGPAIRLNPERFPAVVVMPQCPENVYWSSAEDDITESIERTLEEYNIDRRRIYLTGLSMGGYGTWTYGAKNVERFAALIPICGGGSADYAEALAKRPIWAFHGADDQVVLPERSTQMVEAVNAEGGDVNYTEFPETGHNSWDQTYQNEETIEWLFDQKL